MSTFSIVTPSFNQGRYLREALESVRGQQHPGTQHVVIDGGSTDNSVGTLQGLRDVPGWSHLEWQSRPDKGQSSALNRGFALAKGEIIGWLNSDDRYRPGCFNLVERAFQEHPEVDIFYGDYTWMHEDGQVFEVRREIEFNSFILKYHRVLFIPTTATFFQRRVIEQGFLLREDLHYAMDYEYFLRLTAAGFTIRHLGEVLADFRLHPASKTCRSRELQLEERRQILYESSPSANRLALSSSGRVALLGLETVAGMLRWSQKAIKGAYFQRTSNAVRSARREVRCGS